MRQAIPPRPTGSSREAQYDKAVWDACFGRGAQLISSPTVHVRKGADGISFKAAAQKGSPPAAAATGNKTLIISVIFGRYYICVDPQNNKVYRVAKPYNLRNDILTGTFYGETVNYTYPFDGEPNTGVNAQFLSHVSRQAAILSISGGEIQLIIPPYMTATFGAAIGQFYTIEAIQKTTTGVIVDDVQDTWSADGTAKTGPNAVIPVAQGFPIVWQDINVDARAWSRAQNQAI